MSTLRNKPTDYATTMAVETYATESDLKTVLAGKRDFIRNLCYIVHDKDEDRDTHIHFLVTLSESMQMKRVSGWFKNCKDTKGEICNTFCEELLSKDAMEEYITHSGKFAQKGKHQYDESEIKVLEGIQDARGHIKGKQDLARERAERREQHQQVTEEQNETFLNDLLARKPHREMAVKYGRDYMKNYKNYRQFAWEVELEEGTKTLDDYLKSTDCVLGEQVEARISQESARGFEKGAITALQTIAGDLHARIADGESYYRDMLVEILKLQKEYLQ